jgi:brefeldin A-resistance guanine nucleotide exchange factor 1
LSIRELLRVVVNLLDPTDPAHTDSIRLTALGIITASLSVSINSIPNFRRSLMPIVTDQACKYLFQLVASSDEGVGNSQHSVLILERSLRIVGILFGEERMRRHMKLQLELFLSFTLDRLSPPRVPVPNGAPKLQLSVAGRNISSISDPGHSSNLSVSSSAGVRAKSPDPSAPSRTSMSTADESRLVDGDDDAQSETSPPLPPRLGVLPARGETRELLMETLVHLAVSQPSLIIDLWVNYDCDLNCEDIFDKLITFLTLVGHPERLVHPVIGKNTKLTHMLFW